MAEFMNQIDRIYCLCIESRKKFIIDQFTNLGMLHKLELINAYTPTSPVIDQLIDKQLIYPVYTSNPTTIACGMGIWYIMKQIVERKQKYAMVIEDDVIFPENEFETANRWINPSSINANFDVTKPYVLFLQSSVKQATYGNVEGIVKADVRYGEPAYLTNDVACQILLEHFFPITSPFDEYKINIRKIYHFQVGILIPYVCRELSANYNGFNLQSINTQFVRTAHVAKADISSRIREKPIHANYRCYPFFPEILARHGMKINTTPRPVDGMEYDIGGCIDRISGYLIGSTIRPTRSVSTPFYAIGVRGKISKDIMAYYGISTYAFDFGWTLSQIYPIGITGTKTSLITRESIEGGVCIDNFTLDMLLSLIGSSSRIITDQIDVLAIAHGYGKKVLFAVENPANIDEDLRLMIEDYHSNFHSTPCVIKSFKQVIAEGIDTHYPPIGKPLLELALSVLPFVPGLHKFYQRFHTQATKGSFSAEPDIFTDNRSITFDENISPKNQINNVPPISVQLVRKLYVSSYDPTKLKYHFVSLDTYLKPYLDKFDFITINKIDHLSEIVMIDGVEKKLSDYELVLINASVYASWISPNTELLHQRLNHLSKIPHVILLMHDMHIRSIIPTAGNYSVIEEIDGEKTVICLPDTRWSGHKLKLLRHFTEMRYQNIISIYHCPEFTDLKKLLGMRNTTNNFYLINHVIPINIFKPMVEEKIYDVLIYGTIDPKYYRLRSKIHNICLTLDLRYRQIESSENIREESLAREINRAWITICCSSNYSYMVRRYLEISGCNSTVIADSVPQLWAIIGNNMINVNLSDSSQIISNKIKYYLDHKEILTAISAASVDQAHRENYQVYAQRLEDISQNVLDHTREKIYLAPDILPEPSPRNHRSSLIECPWTRGPGKTKRFERLVAGVYTMVYQGRIDPNIIYRDGYERILNHSERFQYDPVSDQSYITLFLRKATIIRTALSTPDGILYKIRGVDWKPDVENILRDSNESLLSSK
jgi:GR25 family glycosyltransferase involved in LPS biosynthesis